MGCSLCFAGYFLGLALLIILIVIGLQIIQFLARVNTIAKRVDTLTDVQTWVQFFKSTFFKSKSSK